MKATSSESYFIVCVIMYIQDSGPALYAGPSPPLVVERRYLRWLLFFA